MLKHSRWPLLALPLFLVAAAPPNGEGEKHRIDQIGTGKSLQQIAIALEGANQPKLTEKPCPQGRENRSSDLCAQWKAADAASTAAFWAMVGSLLAGVAGVGLYWQIVLTRRAIKGTDSATIQMVRSNEIGERTASATLATYRAQIASSRPLMQLDTTDSLVRARPLDSPYNSCGGGPVESFTMRYRFRNYGEQPCWIVSAWIGFFVGRHDDRGQLDIPSELHEQFRLMTAGFVPPGEAIGSEGAFYQLRPDQSELFLNGGAGVIMYGFCQYRSLAGHLFSTRFAYTIAVGENTTWGAYPIDDPEHWRDGFVSRPKLGLTDSIEYIDAPL